MVAPLPPVQAWLARNYSGVAIRYAPGGAPAPRVAGARLPGCRVVRGDGPAVGVAELFHDGRFVLLDDARGRAAAAGVGSGGTGDLPRHVRAVPYTGCEPARLLRRCSSGRTDTSPGPPTSATQQPAPARSITPCAIFPKAHLRMSAP